MRRANGLRYLEGDQDAGLKGRTGLKDDQKAGSKTDGWNCSGGSIDGSTDERDSS